jgi:putative two-component system protein, hydrogenase maturation factor HypX/HoxX
MEGIGVVGRRPEPMRILLLTHGFNSLTQRLFVELEARGHEVSVEFDINDAVALDAVRLAQPEVIVAPFLKRAIPEAIWREHVCLVVHPGPVGDRGPAALDWAILEGAREWGVTVLQAEAEMDAGPVWTTATFAMRDATKSSLYRNEVTETAVGAVLEALEKLPDGPARRPARTWWKPAVPQARRAIDWTHDDNATVLRKIRSADGHPGVLDRVLGESVHLFDAHPAPGLGGEPGRVVACGGGAICRATVDGAVWIGHLRRQSGEPAL